MAKKSIGLAFFSFFSLHVLMGQGPALHTHEGNAIGQDPHPHILVHAKDKGEILEKIAKQEWAGKVYAEMKARLAPYVARHVNDPEWILSRYLMNRVPGRRYTDFVSDADGTALVSYLGDAPFPTVRVAPHKRQPISKDGFGYRQPSIEELLPYDTSMQMYLTVNSPVPRKEWTDPQTFVDNINQKINELALDAAVIYWLDGDTAYARFAADILAQWARGAYYQNPIQGPCRTGFLSIQTLGDGSYEPMPLIYDFLYDYLRKNHYETRWYEPVFEKIAHTMTFRGFWNNNWFAAQTPALVFAALSLEDRERQAYYLKFVMEKDTINGSCGHLGMPTLVKDWLTPDGHWKEPGGYHNFPVSSLLISSVALEKNGYPVFEKFPALFKASYVMLKYSFPNLMASSFGDTGPASQSPQCLEIGLAMASRYDPKMYGELASAMRILQKEKGYQRDQTDHFGLLCYLPEIRQPNEIPEYKWPRSGTLDFAKAYFQRNGTDKKHGLMYVVQGASYNHNHANGMSMELYGSGSVMGPDPGNGLTYEDPMHVGYYAQWGAHNTVIAGGSSTSVPAFKGGGGTKHMGEILLEAMEPMAEQSALSDKHSFTVTSYRDEATHARQERTMAIVRTSGTTGYYVDIFRSDHPRSNEYIYHNIGVELKLMNEQGSAIDLVDADLPLAQAPFDPPGLRYVKQLKSTGNYAGQVNAVFRMEDELSRSSSRHMRVVIPEGERQTYFTGMAPPTKTVLPYYLSKPTPTLIIRRSGEAWQRPFVAVFEPHEGAGSHVTSVQNLNRNDRNSLTALRVGNRDRSEQLIFQSLMKDRRYHEQDWAFKGSFGIVRLMEGKPVELYLGAGDELTYGDYSIKSLSGSSAASMTIGKDGVRVSCDREVTVRIRNRNIRVAAGRDLLISN